MPEFRPGASPLFLRDEDLRQGLDMLGEEVGHFSILGIAPTVPDHVQLRRIVGISDSFL